MGARFVGGTPKVNQSYADRFGMPAGKVNLQVGYWGLEVGYAIAAHSRIRITPKAGVGWHYVREADFPSELEWEVTDDLGVWSRPAASLGLTLGMRLSIPNREFLAWLGESDLWFRVQGFLSTMDFGDKVLRSGAVRGFSFGFVLERRLLP